jgi:hypothetical protein
MHDVISLFPPTFITAQTVLEEIPLPFYAKPFGGPSFPFGHNGFDVASRRREGNESMDMIRHKKEYERPPKPEGLAMGHGFEKIPG